MRRKTSAIIACALLMVCLMLTLTACAPDVFGDWVTEEGSLYQFGTNQVTMDGGTYYYSAKDGEIKIQFTTDIFGSEQSFVVDGTYAIKGNKMTLTLGKSTVIDLTRY